MQFYVYVKIYIIIFNLFNFWSFIYFVFSQEKIFLELNIFQNFITITFIVLFKEDRLNRSRKINHDASCRARMTGLGVIWFEGDNRSRNSSSPLLRALREQNARRLDIGNFQFASDRVIKRVTSLVSVRHCIYLEVLANSLVLPLLWQNERDQALNATTSAFASYRNDA